MKYWYSEIGAKKYEEIGLKYPLHPFDNAYSAFKRKTKSSTDNHFVINKMIRLQIPETDENTQEYILYDLQEIRKDGLGNPKKWTRTNLGIYPIPQRTVTRVFDEDGQPTVKTEGISEVLDGYEFPFTVAKAEELHRLGCVDKVTIGKPKRTEYIVQKLNEYKITCNSYKDWLTGDFETLYATGNAQGVEIPVVRAKPKKNKQQEQSDFQKEILKKNYTTTVKPNDKDEKIKYDEPIVQETVTATTASQARG